MSSRPSLLQETPFGLASAGHLFWSPLVEERVPLQLVRRPVLVGLQGVDAAAAIAAGGHVVPSADGSSVVLLLGPGAGKAEGQGLAGELHRSRTGTPVPAGLGQGPQQALPRPSPQPQAAVRGAVGAPTGPPPVPEYVCAYMYDPRTMMLGKLPPNAGMEAAG